MKSNNITLKLVICCLLITNLSYATTPLYTYDCTAKPTSVFQWDDVKITYPVDQPGIMKVAPAYTALRPIIVFPSALDLTNCTYVKMKIKTTSPDAKVGIYMTLMRGSNPWSSTNQKGVIKELIAGDVWQTVQFDFPTDATFLATEQKQLEIRFTQNLSATWAAGGNFWIDEIAVGGDISTATKSSLQNDISIYPTTTKDALYLNGLDGIDSKIEVCNLNGMSCLRTANTTMLDVSSLSTGVYIVSIVAKNIIIKHKFIKE